MVSSQKKEIDYYAHHTEEDKKIISKIETLLVGLSVGEAKRILESIKMAISYSAVIT